MLQVNILCLIAGENYFKNNLFKAKLNRDKIGNEQCHGINVNDAQGVQLEKERPTTATGQQHR